MVPDKEPLKMFRLRSNSSKFVKSFCSKESPRECKNIKNKTSDNCSGYYIRKTHLQQEKGLQSSYCEEEEF